MKATLIAANSGIVHFLTKAPFPTDPRLGLRQDGCIWARWRIGTRKIELTRSGIGTSLERDWHEPLTDEAVALVEAPIWSAMEKMIEREPRLKSLCLHESA